ncbi:MAG TPA: hypothetical protein VHS31_14120 [Tepidisphaeraceae bacterium]|jgi:hypothetical protein|nr:hypothetical protein [Tepidisphaeraceae bacterium]
MTDPAIATAADYADAMYTARRAKNLLVLLIFVCLLIQLGLFFVARYTDYIIPNSATTQPMPHWVDALQYLVGGSAFIGFILAIVLCFVLLLIVKIMLVGRLIGVARTTSAYVSCLLLIVLLFPWQAFLSNATFTDPNFKIPGVLYTWDELVGFAKFHSELSPIAALKWARFVGWPVIAVIMVLGIQIKSNRGLRQAFGETDPEMSAA